MGGEEEEGGDYSRLFSTQIPPPDDLICFLWEIIHFPETLLDISTAIFLLLLLLFLLIYSFFRTSFQGLSDPHRVALVIFWVSGEKKRKKNQTGKKSNLEDYFILRMKGGGGGGRRKEEGGEGRYGSRFFNDPLKRFRHSWWGGILWGFFQDGQVINESRRGRDFDTWVAECWWRTPIWPAG